MRGLSPIDSAVLRVIGERSTVAGLDLTFSAPKSVSVLFAIADQDMSSALLEAHEQAVDQACAYLAGGVLHSPWPRWRGAVGW